MILCGLFGGGLTFVVVALSVGKILDVSTERFSNQILPIVIGGTVLGLVFGVLALVYVTRAGKIRQAELTNKYVGRRGAMAIYSGLPLCLYVVTLPFVWRYGRVLGQNADVYIQLVVLMVVSALCLVLHERMPKDLRLPLGVIGWLLTLTLALWLGLSKLGDL